MTTLYTYDKYKRAVVSGEFKLSKSGSTYNRTGPYVLGLGSRVVASGVDQAVGVNFGGPIATSPEKAIALWNALCERRAEVLEQQAAAARKLKVST